MSEDVNSDDESQRVSSGKKRAKIFDYYDKLGSNKKRKKRLRRSSSKGIIVGGGSMPEENVQSIKDLLSFRENIQAKTHHEK